MQRTAALSAVIVACLGACAALTGCVIYLNPQCNDQIHNGDETGVDCGGGGGCHLCDFGQGCRVDNDCDGNNCVSGTCQPPPCENKVRDGAETDVNCGGGTCRKCSGGRHCEADSDCFSGTCVPGTKVCSSITVSFADEVRFLSGTKPYAMFSGDLDGDGDTDLVVANEYGSSVAVFLNDYDKGAAFNHVMNSGEARDDQAFPKNFPTGLYPTGGALGDFDGDGHLDVVTADYHGDSVSVLLSTGTSPLSLRPPVTYPTLTCLGDPAKRQGCAETSNLAVGDLNKDGALDVIATNPGRASVSLFFGHLDANQHPDGTLSPAVDTPVGINGGSQPYSTAIGDFNGDGFDDIAIAEEVSGTIIVRLGNGNGTFQAEVGYEIRGTRDYIVIARDINLDGHLDLLCANRGSDSVSVLLGRGDGTFRKAIVSSVRPDGAPMMRTFSPYAIAVVGGVVGGVAQADFNRDGVPDIVTPNYMAGSATILLGIGDGSFEPAIEVPFTMSTTTPYGVAAGDFNGDGKADFAITDINVGTPDLIVKRNTGH